MVPALVAALMVSVPTPAFCEVKVKVAVDVALPALAIVSSATLSAPPVVVRPTVWPAPSPLTMFPYSSVTLTDALRVPLFPRPASSQVKRQGTLRLPALAAAPVHARRLAAAGLTA